MDHDHDEPVEEGEFTEPVAIPSALAREHPRLYGVLLSVNQKMDDAGTNAIWFVGFAAIGLCVAIHVGWLESAFGLSLEGLRSWGVYTLIILAGIFVGGSIVGWLEKRAYHSGRDEIQQALRQSGLDRYSLLAEIETDDGLEEVRALLKKDDGL